MNGLSLRTQILIDEVHALVFGHCFDRRAALARADAEAISTVDHIHVLLVDVTRILLLVDVFV